MNLLQCNQESISFQSLVQDWINILTLLYREFVPITIQKRQNVNLAKLSDLRLPALMCLQVQIYISNQRSFYRLLILLKLLDLPERSRFNRLTQRCGILFQYIRTKIVNQKDKPQYTIIDSLPATSPRDYIITVSKAVSKLLAQGINETKISTKKESNFGRRLEEIYTKI